MFDNGECRQTAEAIAARPREWSALRQHLAVGRWRNSQLPWAAALAAAAGRARADGLWKLHVVALHQRSGKCRARGRRHELHDSRQSALEPRQLSDVGPAAQLQSVNRLSDPSIFRQDNAGAGKQLAAFLDGAAPRRRRERTKCCPARIPMPRASITGSTPRRSLNLLWARMEIWAPTTCSAPG